MGSEMNVNFKEGRPQRLTVLLAILCALPLAAYAADWPTFRGNWARTGYVAEQAEAPLTQAWVFQDDGGGIVSSPVVFDDVVYFGTRGNKVYALDARTGAVKSGWPVQTGGWMDATPSVSSGTVYAPSLDGYLYALNRRTGALLWKASLGAPSTSSPLVYNGRVFVGTSSPQNKLKVLDAASGAALGEYSVGQPVDSAPAAYGANVYFGANNGKIYAVNRITVAPPADHHWNVFPSYGSFGMNSVAVSSGTLYALPGRDEKKVFALDTSSGDQTGVSLPVEESDSWEDLTSPVVSPDRIYFAGGHAGDYAGAPNSNSLYALDRGDLTSSAWASPPSLGGLSDIGVISAPAMAGDELFAGTNDGRLVSVSSGGVAASPDAPLPAAAYSSPAVSNGMVFIGTMGGQLLGFKAQAVAAISDPKADDIVSGAVPVNGYIANPALSGYELDYGSGVEPSSWTVISSAAVSAEIKNGAIGSWNASVLPNGIYSLRLSVSPGSGNTALVTLRVNAAPAQPSGLTAADVPGDTGNRLQLAWSASTATVTTAYDVYRSSYGVFNLLVSVDSGTLSYIDPNAVTGTTYTYAVRAFDGYSESADSNHAAAFSVNNNPGSDHIAPAAVGDLAAAQGSAGGRAALSWTGTGNDGIIGAASGYAIRYSTSPGFDWNNFGAAALWKSSRPVTGPYGTAEREEVRGLSGGVTYYFAIEAYDGNANFSSTSNVASAWALANPAVPGAPSALAVVDTPGDHGGSLTLSWTRSPDDAAGAADFYGYKIYRRAQAGVYVSSAPLSVPAPGITGYVDTAAPVNQDFCYSAAAYNSTHDSLYSTEACGFSEDNWHTFDYTQDAVLRLTDGAEIDIPGHAASQPDSVLLTKLDPVTYLPLFAPKANAGARPTGVVYAVRFENTDTKLLKSAKLSLPYGGVDVTGMEQENLRIYTMQPGGTWLLLNTSSVDLAAKKVSADIVGFSTFSVMEYIPSGPALVENEVYTYPNPAKGDTLTFKFRVAYKSDVTVDVYNVAGEKVARLEKNSCPAGIPSEIPWRTKGIASGVYVYRVEARTAAGKKTIEKKLAIIH